MIFLEQRASPMEKSVLPHDFIFSHVSVPSVLRNFPNR